MMISKGWCKIADLRMFSILFSRFNPSIGTQIFNVFFARINTK